MPVVFVEVSVLSHATEDKEKVLEAFKHALTEEVYGETEIAEDRLEGHYGNPITLLKVRVNRKAQVRKILENVFSKLEDPDRRRLLSQAENHIDEGGSFYLRLDKQAAYVGKMKLANADPLRLQVKLSIPRRQREKLLEACRNLIHGQAD